VIRGLMPRQGDPAGIERCCRLAGVSRAGYYRHWQASAPRQEETALRDAIQRLSLADRHGGYRRITAQLRQAGWAVNHKRVQRLRRADNLLCLRKPAFRPATTDSHHRFEVYPNLARKLLPTAVNQLWMADITYVRLDEAFVYLAVVLDAFSRKVVGWALADHLPGGTGAGRPGDGAGQPRGGGGWAGAPLGPRGAVCLRRLCCAAQTGWHPARHEPERLSVGQRDGGELHGDAEARGSGRAGLSRPG